MREAYPARPIGFIRSDLKLVEDVPMFYTEDLPGRPANLANRTCIVILRASILI
jgi:hypothetical protein